MPVIVITPPASEPVTLAEAKAFARIDHTDEDDLIADLITAAREHVELATDRALEEQTLELVLDTFPANEILVPRPPLIDVLSVKYQDVNDVEQTLATSAFTVDTASQPGRIVPDGAWPATFNGINAVRIRYRAGYIDAAGPPAYVLPARVRTAIKALVAHWVDERQPVPDGPRLTEIPYHVTRLIQGLSVWRL